MKVAVIHGQSHKGVTYTMTKEVLKDMKIEDFDVQEFFLPKDGPGFCIGCCTCFLKGEEHCQSADKVQPIIKAMEDADVIILDSPNYVMEMSGSMKNLMDHLAYRWVTHRPNGKMFTKVGVAICSSAGSPCNHTTHSLAKQLKWMGVSKIYEFPLISNAMNAHDISNKKQKEIEDKARKIAKNVVSRVRHSHVSIRGRFLFLIFRKMQMSPSAAWNPTDKSWWEEQGWLGNVRPWKKN